MELSTAITYVKGVGPSVAAKLQVLGVENIGDLLDFYPRKYIDYSVVLPIAKLRPGTVSIRAKVKQVRGRYVRGGLHITEAIASDETGSVRIVWFNQPYRANAVKHDADYYISGPFELKANRLSITNPSMELVSDFPVSTARIVPIYKETKGLSSLQIRKILRTVFDSKPEINETLPSPVIKTQKLIPRSEAVQLKHFPNNSKDLAVADERLGFEELFELILAALSAKKSIYETSALSIPFNKTLAQDFVKHLPFSLTDAQRKSVWETYQDISQPHPMNRLLEGDVGSGKTVVAAMAAVMAIKVDFQVALMAPTELLARQHADTLYKLLEPLGMSETVTLLVGSMNSATKKRAREFIGNGKAKLIIGTHALIQEKVNMDKLALVVVDEQHRFGVDQRKKLLAKAGHAPHMLSMTATPIPRSLALTVFGEVEVSILDEKPKNRLPIVTKLVKPGARDKLYSKLEDHLMNGEQIFIVCPVIEASELMAGKAVTEVYEQISKKFKAQKVGLLHGKLKADEKQAIMQEFLDKKIHILVSTTVIEVGVDVPNATVMLIEAPERFGLAQLHQLRGRVGRGDKQGYCYLMLSDDNAPSKRLRAIETTQDGFKLAELDLALRGAGSLYGISQHGILDLRIANFTDTKLIARARKAAREFIDDPDNLIQYPYIKERILQLQTVVHLN